MRRWYSSEKVRALDARLIEAGVPGLELMERVGCGIADFILCTCPGKNSALILAGSGNNGGDGFVIARVLKENGWDVDVLLSHSPDRSRDDAVVNLWRLQKMNVSLVESSSLDDEEISSMMRKSGIVVDALLGTGAAGVPRGETARLISLTNAARRGRHVLAVDLPSGAEGGVLSIEAEWTCTAAGRKLVCATGRGAALAGKIELIDLDERQEELLGEPDARELTDEDIRAMLPRRHADDHKGSRSGVLVVAGSPRYRGAALLAARGALRMGAGFVVLASVPEVLDAMAVALPEAIAEPLNFDELPGITKKWRPRCSALLVGSGLDRDDRSRAICRAAESWDGASLWDGDGLYWLAHDGLKPFACCLTPHEGEAATLLGEKINDRFAAVNSLSKNYGVTLLKGYRSLVGEDGKTPWIVPRGDRTLSIPGSGDVLAGAVSALLATGISARTALAAAAWCHGEAGEILGREKGRDGVLAREVADALPFVLKRLNDEKDEFGK